MVVILCVCVVCACVSRCVRVVCEADSAISADSCCYVADLQLSLRGRCMFAAQTDPLMCKLARERDRERERANSAGIQFNIGCVTV